MATLNEIKELSVYALARLAGCSDPDSLTSPGAEYLDTVRTSFVEAIEYSQQENPDWPSRCADESADPDSVVPYTAEMWKTFVDLAAYFEGIETGETTLEAMAKRALYQVGYRLFQALAQELDTPGDEEEGEE